MKTNQKSLAIIKALWSEYKDLTFVEICQAADRAVGELETAVRQIRAEKMRAAAKPPTGKKKRKELSPLIRARGWQSGYR